MINTIQLIIDRNSIKHNEFNNIDTLISDTFSTDSKDFFVPMVDMLNSIRLSTVMKDV